MALFLILMLLIFLFPVFLFQLSCSTQFPPSVNLVIVCRVRWTAEILPFRPDALLFPSSLNLMKIIMFACREYSIALYSDNVTHPFPG